VRAPATLPHGRRPPRLKGAIKLAEPKQDRQERNRNIKLREDCALSLFSGGIGRAGDAAIFSLPKSLPACDGGALLLVDVNAAVNRLTRGPAVVATARDVVSLVKKMLQTSLRLVPAGRSECWSGR
jgi:hypothetical protein